MADRRSEKAFSAKVSREAQGFGPDLEGDGRSKTGTSPGASGASRPLLLQGDEAEQAHAKSYIFEHRRELMPAWPVLQSRRE